VPFALVADFCIPEGIGEAMGKIGAFQSAGLIAGPLLVSFFIRQFQYFSVFYISSALAILAALMVLLGVPEKPEIPAKAEVASRALISNFKEMAKKNVIIACTNYAFSAAFFGVSVSHFVVHANSVLGIERAYLVSLLLTFYLIVEAVIQFPSGKLSDLIGRNRIVTLGFVTSAFGFLILSFAYFFEYLLIGIIMIGVGVGTLYAALISLVMDITASSKRGFVAGLLNIAWGVGYFVGPFVGGIISTYTFSAPYLFCIIMAVIGTTLAISQSEQLNR
jgi:MFS family permease